MLFGDAFSRAHVPAGISSYCYVLCYIVYLLFFFAQAREFGAFGTHPARRMSKGEHVVFRATVGAKSTWFRHAYFQLEVVVYTRGIFVSAVSIGARNCGCGNGSTQRFQLSITVVRFCVRIYRRREMARLDFVGVGMFSLVMKLM